MKPTISICMIVKDESEMLAGALESVRSIAAELIVVDTGSTDDTIAIARRCGARVSCHTWRDDFAAARNDSIAAARCDWVLVWDADQRLPAASARAIEAQIAQPAALDAYTLIQHDAPRALCNDDTAIGPELRELEANMVLSGLARVGAPWFAYGLFRRSAEPRYTQRLHENVEVWAKARGIAVTPAPGAHVLHYSYRGPEKLVRNVRILELMLEEDGPGVRVLGYLAQHAYESRDFAKCRELVDQAAALEEYSSLASWGDCYRIAVLRGWLAERARDVEQLRHAADEVARTTGIRALHPDALYFRGRASELLGDVGGALVSYQLAIVESERPYPAISVLTTPAATSQRRLDALERAARLA